MHAFCRGWDDILIFGENMGDGYLKCADDENEVETSKKCMHAE